MKLFLDLLFTLADYLKLEWHESKRGLVDLGIARALVHAAGVILVAALGLVLFAIFMGCLSLHMSMSVAACITALFALLFSLLLVWIAYEKVRN